MTTPTKLIFREWKKPEVTVELCGWSSQKGLAFVKGDGRRQVIQLVLPGLLAQGGIAFPGGAPTMITETRLMPPPCRTTAEEAACLRAAAAESRLPRRAAKPRNASDLPNWELVWLRHRNEILLPTPADQSEFEKRLEVSMPKWRQEYEARRRELEDWRTKTIGQMIYLGGGRFYRDLHHCKPASMLEQIERHLSLLETTYTRPLKEFLGRVNGGFLNWTGDVAKHEPIIRDPVLHQRWARENGLKLTEINADKQEFLDWYRAHYSTLRRLASTDFLDVVFPGAGAAMADNSLCAEIRFVANFPDGSRVWLADCLRRDPLLTAEEQQPFKTPAPTLEPVSRSLHALAFDTERIATLLSLPEAITKASQQARADVEAGAATLGAQTKDIAAERQKLEVMRGKLAGESQMIETATHQLDAKVKALSETISPINRLYADVEIAEIRKQAVGKKVPELIVDWVMSQFMGSNPPRLPTKGDVFNNCGPDTAIGKRLEKADYGISKQRFADHLTVIRQLLVARGWLPRNLTGKTRKRAGGFNPDGRLEDINQPNPAESAGDRDDEREAAALGSEEEADQEQAGDTSSQSDAD